MELEALLNPDVVLPSQWNDVRRRSPALDGMHKLMLAVLEDAVEIITKHGRGASVKPRQVVSDLYWMFSRSEEPFSMRSCCYFLDIEPEVIRRGMVTFIKEHKGRFELLGW